MYDIIRMYNGIWYIKNLITDEQVGPNFDSEKAAKLWFKKNLEVK